MNKKLFLFALGASTLGVFTSVTLCALNHILLVVLFFKTTFEKKINFKKIVTRYYSSRALLLFILFVIISLLISQNSFSNYRHLKYFLLGLFSFIFSDFIAHKVTKKELSIIFKLSIAAILFASFYGFVKAFLGFDILHLSFLEKVQSSNYARNPGLTGVMRFSHGSSWILTMLVGFILYQYKFLKKLNIKYILLSILILAGLISTGVRGALLGFLVSLPILIFYFNKKIFLLSLFAILLSIFGYVQYTNKHKENGPIRILNLNSRSTSIRINQMKGALAIIKDNFWGIGPKNVDKQIDIEKEKHQYLNQYNFKDNEHFTTHSHNLFLELMAAYGIIPCLIFIIWLLSWAKDLFLLDNYRIILMPFFFNYVTSSQFEYTLDANNSFLLFLFYALSPLIIYHYKIEHSQTSTN